MQCNKVREAISLARYEGQKIDPSIAQHMDRCAECRAFANADARLDELLRVDPPMAPGPGFDTRFFARLAEEKASRQGRATSTGHTFAQFARQWRWVLAGISVASAAALILVTRQPLEQTLKVNELARLTAQDMGLLQNLELVQELDLVRRLDEVETFEVVAQLEIGEIERAGDQPETVILTDPQSSAGVSR